MLASGKKYDVDVLRPNHWDQYAASQCGRMQGIAQTSDRWAALTNENFSSGGWEGVLQTTSLRSLLAQ